MIIGIIPARYASTRLPGKPLIDLNGQTMIERVWRGVSASPALDRVLIATDDERVIADAQRFGAEAYLTSPDLQSGTDRCDALLRQLKLDPTIVVNIQGDEPLVQAVVITDLVQAIRASGADVATLITPITHASELADPSTVKVVVNADGKALYFSRSPIPYVRDHDHSTWTEHHQFWKHVGIYAYTYRALKRHVQLPPSSLERAESLEQLRLLEDGAVFHCVRTDDTFLSVDTAADVERVLQWLRVGNPSR